MQTCARTHTDKQADIQASQVKASGVYPCSHPPTHPWIHRSIYPSIHPSIHQLTRSHIHTHPSLRPSMTFERIHARPFIPSSTQPSSQPAILASSSQPTSKPSQETIDRSARFLHGCCRLRATNNALEPEPIKSIFSYQRYSYIPACFIIFPARFLHF